jgi:hypothetical protein
MTHLERVALISASPVRPFTTNAVAEWQLGEIDAVLGRPPFTRLDETMNGSAYNMGYFSAYKKVNGRDWSLPPIPPQPENALLFFREHVLPQTTPYLSASQRAREMVQHVAHEHGIQHVDAVVRRCEAEPYSPVACPVVIGVIIGVHFDAPLHQPFVSVSVDFMKGDYDFRPGIERAVIPVLRRLTERYAIDKAERERRHVVRNGLNAELLRVFGESSYCSGLGPPERDISTITLTPTNEQLAAFRAWLNEQPAKQ